MLLFEFKETGAPIEAKGEAFEGVGSGFRELLEPVFDLGADAGTSFSLSFSSAASGSLFGEGGALPGVVDGEINPF